MDPATYVLRDFSAAERKNLDVEIDRAADAVETLVTDGLERAQNNFNS
jgi:PTH1 family peptidyl-tRNA hydrolase